MRPHPAVTRRSSRAIIALAVVAAGATFGSALFRQGGPSAPPVDLVRVTLPSGEVLFVQRTEVTVRDWARCHAEGGWSLALRDPDAGQDYPATGVSCLDAQEYLAWINAGSGLQYRLPTRAEWYAVAGEVLPETLDPIFTAPELSWASAYLVAAPGVDRVLHPTGACQPNPVKLSKAAMIVCRTLTAFRMGERCVPAAGRCSPICQGRFVQAERHRPTPQDRPLRHHVRHALPQPRRRRAATPSPPSASSIRGRAAGTGMGGITTAAVGA